MRPASGELDHVAASPHDPETELQRPPNDEQLSERCEELPKPILEQQEDGDNLSQRKPNTENHDKVSSKRKVARLSYSLIELFTLHKNASIMGPAESVAGNESDYVAASPHDPETEPQRPPNRRTATETTRRIAQTDSGAGRGRG